MNDTPTNIIQLDIVRIERHKPRKCTCDKHNMKFTIDTENREVICACGIKVDPFEALANLAKYYDRINQQHLNLNDQRNQWLKENHTQ